jgi:hypothetical protein
MRFQGQRGLERCEAAAPAKTGHNTKATSRTKGNE